MCIVVCTFENIHVPQIHISKNDIPEYMNTLNPYELLGVSRTSSKDEVRRAYYRLAMIVHPDRGGTSTDMQVLHTAYEWVINHVNVVENREGAQETYEEKEAAFKNFLDKQLSHAHKVKTIDEIKAEATAFQNEAFERVFLEMASEAQRNSDFIRKAAKSHVLSRLLYDMEFNVTADTDEHMLGLLKKYIHEFLNIVVTTSVFGSAIDGGYGDLMEDSTPYEDTDVTQPPIAENKSFGKKEIQLYKEPEAMWLPPSQVTSYLGLPKKLEDYTMDNMTDYVKAFQDPTGALSTWEQMAKEREAQSITDALDELVLERKMADLSQAQQELPPTVTLGSQKMT